MSQQSDAICVCSHPHWAHRRAGIAGPSPCQVRDCGCTAFKVAKQPGPNKFHAKAVRREGKYFQSTFEAERWSDLELLERADEIQGLSFHPRYSLDLHGQHITTYEADAVYYENGALVVEDSKGVETPEYRIKRALMKAVLGIEIREVHASRASKRRYR